jgi:hypothetical protein
MPGARVGPHERGQAAGPADERQEDGMSDFGDLEKKAEAYVKEHPEQADKGINEVTGIADRESDHQHDEQIDRAADAAERHLGQGQDPQSSQDQRGGQG